MCGGRGPFNEEGASAGDVTRTAPISGLFLGLFLYFHLLVFSIKKIDCLRISKNYCISAYCKSAHFHGLPRWFTERFRNQNRPI